MWDELLEEMEKEDKKDTKERGHINLAYDSKKFKNYKKENINLFNRGYVA